MRYVVFCLLLFFISLSASGQQIVVLDADSGFPIVNAVVFNQDKSKTVVTDFDGKCDLSLFSKNERITFRHISYETFKTSPAQIIKRGNSVYLSLKPEQLDEVVMSISKWEQQRKDVPQKILSLSAKEIAFTNPQTAADLLQNSGKVFVQKSQLGGGSPLIRGFATNRVLISVDGVRLNTAIFRGGNVQNIISIDPFTIKNTEVIFGPGSVIYGSDAIGGVMNFFTHEPKLSNTDSLTLSGNVSHRFSTANTENTTHLDFNYGKKNWAAYTSFTYNDFGDLRTGANGPDAFLRNNFVVRQDGQDVLVENDNPRLQTPSGYNQVNFLQKFKYKPNNIWDYNLGLYYSTTSDYDRFDRLIRPGRDGTGLRSAEWFYGPQEWFMGNFQITKKGKGKFYDGLKITTAYQHFEESRNDRDFQDTQLFSRIEDVDALSANIDFENKKIGNLRLYYGAEYIFNLVSSEAFQRNIETNEVSGASTRYPDGSTWQTAAAYINGEYKAKPNLTLLGGLRYSQVFLDAEFDSTFFDFPFDEANVNSGALTGSIGISWFPKADLQVTLNGSTAFRAPNVDDIGKVFDSEPGSVVVPNTDLVSEYAYTGELSIKKNFNDKLVLRGTTYYTFLEDALVRRDFEFNGQREIEFNGELSNVQAIQNAARAFVYGFEFGVEAFFNENLSFASNLTITEGVEEDDDGTESPARHVAPTFADAHLVWKNQKWKADLFLNYNGEIPFEDLAFSERNTPFLYDTDENGNPFSPSWYTLNFRSNYTISNNVKATLALENITNQLYRTFSSGISAPGFNVILGLGYKF